MGLFGLFKGKDPVKHEQQGDYYFDTTAFGQAKLEYEAALAKRRRAMSNDAKIPQLQDKILQCREALAREHKKRGDDLLESGYLKDAGEYYALALDLTQDAELIRALEDCRQRIEYRQSEKYRKEIQVKDEPEPEIVAPSVPESEDEYATALFNTLPEGVCDAYINYGSSFKTGYIALNKGQFDIAADALSRALEEHPEPEFRIRFELATAYLNLKRFEEARVLFEEFIVHHPDDLPAYQMLCEIYWEAGEFDRAQRLLDSIPDDQQRTPDCCLLRGETLFRAGKYPEAGSLYLDFLGDNGWDSDIARALAGTYEAAGDLNTARELYGKIIGQCSGCGVRVDPQIKRKYADLSMATGIQNEKILDLYLSLADQDPVNAAGYYQKVSQIYAALGHEKEARRFQSIALGRKT
jgi:tetratricopeptide (TPR) repeat protein